MKKQGVLELQGEFTKSDRTLKEMTARVITQIEKMKIDARAIEMTISSLPNLKRWKNAMLAI